MSCCVTGRVEPVVMELGGIRRATSTRAFVSKALACQLGNESGGRGGGLATQNTEVTQRFLQLDSVILRVISESVFISLPNCLTTSCYVYLKTG